MTTHNNANNMNNNTTFSTFKNIKNSTSREYSLTLDEIFEIIRNNPKSKEILAAREGGKSSEIYDRVKTSLQCVTYNGNFESRNMVWVNENKNSLSGYIYFDIDSFAKIIERYNLKSLEEAKERVLKMLKDNGFGFVKAVWSSFGGKGIGFLVKVENLTVKNFKTTWEAISKQFTSRGIEIDAATKDITRLNVISYDPDIFIREDGEIRPFQAVEPKEEKIKIQTDIDFTALDCEESNEVLSRLFNILMGIQGCYSDNNTRLNYKFFVDLFMISNTKGVELDDVLNFLKQKSTNFPIIFNYRSVDGAEEIGEKIYNRYSELFGTKKTIYDTENDVKNDIIIIPEGKHLSDVISFENCLNKMVSAPAGVGKTTLFISSNNDKILFVAPTQSICNDIAAQYKDVEVFHQYEKTATVESQKIVTTVSSFTKLAKMLGDSLKNFTVIVDEVHCFVTNTSKNFAYKQYKKMLDFLKLDLQKNVIFCTATMPNFSDPYLSHFEVLKFKREIDKNIVYKTIPCVDRKKYIKKLFAKTKDKKSFVVVFKNNKTLLLNQLQTALSGYKYMTVNADNKYTEEVSTMIGERKIKSDLNGLISTSVIGEGVNLYLGDDRNNEVHVVIDGNISSEQIYQFSDRVRDAKKTVIHILQNADFEGEETDFNENVERGNLIRMAENNVKTLNVIAEANKINETFVKYEVNQFVAICYDSEKNILVPDYLTIDNQLFKMKKDAERKSNVFLKNQMMRFGISFESNETSTEVLDEKEKKKISKKSKDYLVKKSEQREEIIKKIKEEGLVSNNDRVDKNEKFEAAESEIRKQIKFISMYESDKEKVFAIFEKFASTKQKWTMFKQQIEVQKIKTNSYDTSRIKKLTLDIYDTFKVNCTYTPAQTNFILTELIEKHSGGLQSNETKSITATTQMLKKYFNTTMTKADFEVDGETVRKNVIKIIDDNPCKLNINTDVYIKLKNGGDGRILKGDKIVEII